MKLKKVMLPLSFVVAITPIATVVACGNTSNSGKDNEIQELKQKIDDLKTKLQSSKNDSKNQGDIDKLNDQLLKLQAKLKQLDQTASTKNDTVVKGLTQFEKTQNFQAFQMLNASQLSKLSLDDVKKTFDPNLPMARGIENFALSQTCSYLYNLALKLGLKQEDKQITDMSKNPSGDAILDADRAEVYAHTKTMIDGLKVVDDKQLSTIMDTNEFKSFYYPYSNGGEINKMRLTLSGIDFTSFGKPDDHLPVLEDDSAVKHYSNFDLTTKNKNTISLFSNWNAFLDKFGAPKIMGYQYINADKPGYVTTQLQFPSSYEVTQNSDNSYNKPVELLQPFSKSFEISGLVPVFPKSDVSDRHNNLIVLEGIVRKMSVIFSVENQDVVDSLKNDAKQFSVASNFIDALEFLGSKFQVHGGFNLQDLSSAYDQLNNGSHYFKAVELVSRGMSGTDFIKNSSKYEDVQDTSYLGIIDMAFDHIAKALLPWSVLQGYGSYTVSSNAFSPIDIRTYKPSK